MRKYISKYFKTIGNKVGLGLKTNQKCIKHTVGHCEFVLGDSELNSRNLAANL